jgi:hypothetical protein
VTVAKRHLHRDYSTAFCGKDAAHILMTYEPGDADCATCLRKHRAAANDKS